MENVKDWLKDNYGYGYGYGDGDGDGSGSVYGYGYGYSDGDGSGSVYGDGYGYGYSDGYGSGRGSGDGSGDGSGSGRGSGIKCFNGNDVYFIDGIPTIISHIKDGVAKGFILNKDFTKESCYIVKGNGYFAHGKTLKDARESLIEKFFESMDGEEVIEKFLDTFRNDEKYPGTEFFKWHHYLTGSCLMGRESFVKNRGLSLDDLYTVDEFIELCENDYGSDIIKQLKERWNR